MKRTIYVAGINRKHLAAQASSIPYWLLSVTLLRKYPSWLHQHVRNRMVLWDPGTFSEDPVSYSYYRAYIDRYIRSTDEYLQYDEIGDSEATSWYLQDMRKRGYNPTPILQGNAFHLLKSEKKIAIGGLVRLSNEERVRYLDHIFYDYKPSAEIHLLGMKNKAWFEPYAQAVQGDNTSWIPRSKWNRKKSIEEWMLEYGEQWMPYKERQLRQLALF